jgi:hypothetical protein
MLLKKHSTPPRDTRVHSCNSPQLWLATALLLRGCDDRGVDGLRQLHDASLHGLEVALALARRDDCHCAIINHLRLQPRGRVAVQRATHSRSAGRQWSRRSAASAARPPALGSLATRPAPGSRRVAVSPPTKERAGGLRQRTRLSFSTAPLMPCTCWRMASRRFCTPAMLRVSSCAICSSRCRTRSGSASEASSFCSAAISARNLEISCATRTREGARESLALSQYDGAGRCIKARLGSRGAFAHQLDLVVQLVDLLQFLVPLFLLCSRACARTVRATRPPARPPARPPQCRCHRAPLASRSSVSLECSIVCSLKESSPLSSVSLARSGRLCNQA